MMTFRFAKCAVAIGAIGLAGVLQSSAQAANTTATASAVVATAIGISKTFDMDFGTVAEDGSGGTIILATDGSRTITGGASALSGSPGAAASFAVTGEGANTYTIVITGDPVTLDSGGNTMTATTFVTLPTPTGTLSGGAETLLVGATLTLAAGQATGTYLSATPFTVTVAYN